VLPFECEADQDWIYCSLIVWGVSLTLDIRLVNSVEKKTISLNLNEVVMELAQIYLYIALTVKSFKDLILPKIVYGE
jgi:hypothetical protein